MKITPYLIQNSLLFIASVKKDLIILEFTKELER